MFETVRVEIEANDIVARIMAEIEEVIGLIQRPHPGQPDDRAETARDAAIAQPLGTA